MSLAAAVAVGAWAWVRDRALGNIAVVVVQRATGSPDSGPVYSQPPREEQPL